jgi:hypothetical protein
MLMIQHCGKHNDYNNQVKEVLTKIKGKFSKGESNDEDHNPVDDENIPNLKVEINQWSSDEATELFLAGHEGQAGDNMNEAPVFGANGAD